jgi:phosphocarrier protein
VKESRAVETTDVLFSRGGEGKEAFAESPRVVRFQRGMVEREVTIRNKLGLHARPAAEFVRAVQGFQSSVSIVKNDACYSGCSILDVLSANLDCGSVMLLRIDGPDAEQAMERLCFLIEEFHRQEEREGI